MPVVKSSGNVSKPIRYPEIQHQLFYKRLIRNIAAYKIQKRWKQNKVAIVI